MNVLSSDIVVDLNGVQVPAFNADNRMAMPFSALQACGDYRYDIGTRISRITLN